MLRPSARFREGREGSESEGEPIAGGWFFNQTTGTYFLLARLRRRGMLDAAFLTMLKREPRLEPALLA